MRTAKHVDHHRIRAALGGPNAEVLRTIAMQPNHPTHRPPAADLLIPVARP